MKVVITGIAGLIGSRLAGWIREAQPGAEVIGVDDLSCGYAENIPPGMAWIRHSLGSGADPRAATVYGPLWPEHPVPRSLEEAFDGADLVYHTAAYAAEGLSPWIRQYNYRNNLVATAEVVSACIRHDVGRLVAFSSMAVYGRGRPPFAEADRLQPIDPYGVAKVACEWDVRIAGEQHGLDWCIIRPHNVTGHHQSIWQRYRNVLGIWIARHLEGLPLRVYGDGRQQRAFSDIAECLEPLWAAGTLPAASGQVINLGGPTPIEIGAAAELLCAVMGGGTIEHCEPRHEVREAWCTTAKSEELLGYRHRIPLRETLEDLWGWAREAWERYPERRTTHRVAPLEHDRGLYGYWRELV